MRLARALFDPFLADERAAVARAARAGLDDPDQLLGRYYAGCGATWGVMERCDFACTACYLARASNAAPPLPFEAVRDQLDTLRAHLGPGARVQITAGEVTLLPAADLVRVLRYARSVQLVPMVMTHGQRFLREPAYLERLVLEGGLDRFAFHVDTTQRGRDGGDPSCETELSPVRDRMAALVRDVRARTGRPLLAAHTVTVTRGNLDEVPDVVRWVVRNADVVRILSLQPVAGVGRTREASNTGRRVEVWDAACRGLGRPANPRALAFGHPACNQTGLFAVIRGRPVEICREGSRLDRWFLRTLLLKGLRGWTPHGEGRAVALARLLGRLARDPRPLLALPLWALARVAGDPRLLLPGRAHPLMVVVHNFMDAGELATPRGRERVAACVFKVPFEGRLVSMCEFNAGGLRARAIAGAACGAS